MRAPFRIIVALFALLLHESTLRPALGIAAERVWPPFWGALSDQEKHTSSDWLETQSFPIEGWEPPGGANSSGDIAICQVHTRIYLRKRATSGVHLLFFLENPTAEPIPIDWRPLLLRWDNRDDLEERPDFFPAHQRKAPLPPRSTSLWSVRLEHPERLSRHRELAIYLPWLGGCTARPRFVFLKTPAAPVTPWHSHLTGGLSGGLQLGIPGWQSEAFTGVWPSPAAYVRYLDLWTSGHGFSLALLAARESSHPAFLAKASYTYAVWFGTWFTFLPEAGIRVLSSQGITASGLGLGGTLAWEVPGTRTDVRGHRLFFELGLGWERFFGSSKLRGIEMSGTWWNTNFGIGWGW